MTLGNSPRSSRTASKRLRAYSTISQAGSLLMAVAVVTLSATAARSLLFYLAAIRLTTWPRFAVAPHCPRPAPRRLPRAHPQHPCHGRMLVVSPARRVGTPPTVVSSPSAVSFTTAIYCCYGAGSPPSPRQHRRPHFYYLRWLAPAFAPRPRRTSGPPHRAGRLGRPPRSPTPRCSPLALGIAGTTGAGPVTGHLFADTAVASARVLSRTASRNALCRVLPCCRDRGRRPLRATWVRRLCHRFQYATIPAGSGKPLPDPADPAAS